MEEKKTNESREERIKVYSDDIEIIVEFHIIRLNIKRSERIIIILVLVRSI